jgi:ribose transport system ATP-binding protein
VDVTSKAQIYRVIADAADAGRAVVMVGSYPVELLGVCDRIAVMHRGVLGAARRAAEWTEHEIVRAATVGEVRP